MRVEPNKTADHLQPFTPASLQIFPQQINTGCHSCMFVWSPHVLSPWRSYKLRLAWIIFHLVVLTWHIILPGIVSIRAPDLWLSTLVTSEQRSQCYLCANECQDKKWQKHHLFTGKISAAWMNNECIKRYGLILIKTSIIFSHESMYCRTECRYCLYQVHVSLWGTTEGLWQTGLQVITGDITWFSSLFHNTEYRK